MESKTLDNNYRQKADDLCRRIKNIVQPDFKAFNFEIVEKKLEHEVNSKIEKVHHSLLANIMDGETAKKNLRDLLLQLPELCSTEIDRFYEQKITGNGSDSLSEIINEIEYIENSAHKEISNIALKVNNLITEIEHQEQLLNPETARSRTKILLDYGFVDGTIVSPPEDIDMPSIFQETLVQARTNLQ